MADLGGQFHRHFIAIAASLGVVGLSAMSAAAGPHSVEACPKANVSVAAATVAERDLACDAAAQAIGRLDRCGIAQARSIQIELAEIVRSPFGTPIFGRFDIAQDVVFVTKIAKLEPLLEGTPYRMLSQADFFTSLIIHEAVHAIMHQNYKRTPTSRAAYEYPAYAIQIEAIVEKSRRSFPLAEGANAADTNILFNDVVLGFDPFFFAARAYEHFVSSPRGCERLQDLLRGEVDFVVTLP